MYPFFLTVQLLILVWKFFPFFWFIFTFWTFFFRFPTKSQKGEKQKIHNLSLNLFLFVVNARVKCEHATPMVKTSLKWIRFERNIKTLLCVVACRLGLFVLEIKWEVRKENSIISNVWRSCCRLALTRWSCDIVRLLVQW